AQLPGFADTHAAIRELSGAAAATALAKSTPLPTPAQPLTVRVAAREAEIAPPTAGELRLVAVKGLSFAKFSAEGNWALVTQGQKFASGNALKTGADGYATVNIGKFLATTVLPNSTVRIDQNTAANVQLQLASGGLRLASAQPADGSPFSSRRAAESAQATIVNGPYTIAPIEQPVLLQLQTDAAGQTASLLVTQGTVEVRQRGSEQPLSVGPGRTATLTETEMRLLPAGE
ncbi:MAG: hypothetical protein KDA41_01415, partial [Planctomycetales bacterium]|nr:hypothetical protein [Planctomycetales bacterium]